MWHKVVKSSDVGEGKVVQVNIEGRLIDEEAATIAGDFRF